MATTTQRREQEHIDALFRKMKRFNRLGAILVEEIRGITDLRERHRVTAWIYDQFAKHGYREHMEDTNHFGAIRHLIDQDVEAGYIMAPFLDPTCGIGVLTRYTIEQLQKRGVQSPHALANDFSRGMLEEARRELKGCDTTLTRIDIIEMAKVLKAMKTGRFRSVIFSQTANVVDRETYGLALREAKELLEPPSEKCPKGGVLNIYEETPFLVTPTEAIGQLAILIRMGLSISPFQGPIELLTFAQANTGLVLLGREQKAVNSLHSMISYHFGFPPSEYHPSYRPGEDTL